MTNTETEAEAESGLEAESGHEAESGLRININKVLERPYGRRGALAVLPWYYHPGYPPPVLPRVHLLPASMLPAVRHWLVRVLGKGSWGSLI